MEIRELHTLEDIRRRLERIHSFQSENPHPEYEEVAAWFDYLHSIKSIQAISIMTSALSQRSWQSNTLKRLMTCKVSMQQINPKAHQAWILMLSFRMAGI